MCADVQVDVAEAAGAEDEIEASAGGEEAGGIQIVRGNDGQLGRCGDAVVETVLNRAQTHALSVGKGCVRVPSISRHVVLLARVLCT